MNCQYGGHGGSLLHTAVAEGDRKAATLLIAAGARFFLETIFLASMRGQFGIFFWKKSFLCVTNFVDQFCPLRVDLPDSNGRTALHIAASLGNKVFVFRLLSFQTSHKYDASQI